MPWEWWVLGLIATGVLVGVILFYLKKIRRHERSTRASPDLVLHEDGKLTTILPKHFSDDPGENRQPGDARPGDRL
ncbi:MAG: hypothetical protein AAGI50_09290 [Pseudomonadota bacterium]